MNVNRFNFKKSAVAKGLLTALYGTAALTGMQQVSAQTAQPSLQRVEVTGSNIRRTDSETSSPIQVLTKDDMDRSGKATVAEYLQTLTSDGQGSVPATYGRGFAGGTATGISLRGLGANATLVLVNGRRVAPAVLADDAQRSFTDLNTIPMEAVERIEVLKDGASSIYGSDAVAGVVNIILKKGFVGTVAKATYGRSSYNDGAQPRASITHGFGDLEKDGFNVLLNLETSKKNAMYFKDRTDRGPVGVSAIATLGFDPLQATNNIGRAGGNGSIPLSNGALVNNSASQSIIGNVRNPTTLNYYSRGNANGVGFTRTFPGAQTFCAANANLPQNDAGGGCITDIWRQVGQVVPDSKGTNFYGRFTKQINADTEGFVEVGLYKTESRVQNTSLVPSGTVFRTDGSSFSNAANTQLGAAHPDNPYFGTAARLSYNPVNDIGARNISASSTATRLLAGAKGTMGVWDYDTAFQFSESKQKDTQEKAINWRVSNALLNPTAANIAAAVAVSPAYAALPAGTVWRIGENANLNSAAMYAALLQDKSREGNARSVGVDFKASREIGKLEGGPIGLAVGAEYRRESNNLPFYDGLGDYVGLSLTKYGGSRNIMAAYGELLFPVTKRIELTSALRVDKYSDAGQAVTPKLGGKWKAMDNFALRSTYAGGFRAPSSAENSASSIAAFSGPTINDRARTAAGVPAQGSVAATFVQRGNTALEPEKSRSLTVGAVWDITPKTSLTADLWQIKRKGLPVLESAQAAVDAGRVDRDTNSRVNAADPGPIITGYVQFINAAQSLTRGLDLDAKHRIDLGDGNGRVNLSATWTRLLKQRVIDADGTIHDYAGTHGNCDITNCMGSPKDRISFNANWDRGAWNLSGTVNYRGAMSNKLEASDTTCADVFANGTDAPAGCKVSSFMTLDVSALYRISKNTEVFGSIQNLLNKKPPLDSHTYGAIGYNPLDYSGAIGRYFSVGLKHKF